MFDQLTHCLIAAAPAPAPNANPAGSPFQFLPLMLMLGFFLYMIVIRPQRREQATRKTMLELLKKNDRIVTVGGIYGVVTNVHPEADELTIKVDESTNTKLRV